MTDFDAVESVELYSSTESNIFYSPCKFINFINDKYKNNKFIRAVCYFEGDETFKNRFNKTCVKPLFITLESANKRNNVYLNYNKINKLFGNSIIINFNYKSEFDKTSSNKMYLFIVEFEQKTYMNLDYYPTHVLECDNQHNIEQIRNQFKVEFDNSDLKDYVF